ncbi:MAG: PIN domain-containing protein [Bacillota bacterium]|jgi:predicted nucleic acid-binding protein
MERVIADTSAIYALIDRSDEFHQKATQIVKELSLKRVDLILTNFVLAETHALILSRLGHELAREWIKNLIWTIEHVKREDEKRAREIIINFQDKTFSYTDASTFAVMERLKIDSAFSFDNHFMQYGWQCF